MRVLPEEDLAVMTLPIGPVGWSTAAKSTPPRLPASAACRMRVRVVAPRRASTF